MTRAARSKSFNLADAQQYQYLTASARLSVGTLLTLASGKGRYSSFATFTFLFIFLVKYIFLRKNFKKRI